MTSATSLKKVWFLNDASPAFMIELSMTLHAVVFAPTDVAPAGFMYIVQRGIALYNGKVLGAAQHRPCPLLTPRYALPPLSSLLRASRLPYSLPLHTHCRSTLTAARRIAHHLLRCSPRARLGATT